MILISRMEAIVSDWRNSEGKPFVVQRKVHN